MRFKSGQYWSEKGKKSATNIPKYYESECGHNEPEKKPHSIEYDSSVSAKICLKGETKRVKHRKK